ncbi:MAG: glycosyltransferase [Thermosediminibacteraceae bacterium]|nr:glycosyltransferase [Thermosediminibacteraceae bacterium]
MKLRGVIILSAVDWNFLRQRVHHLATGMAQVGLKVLFVENTAVRSPRFSDLPRILQKLQTVILHIADKCGESVPENLAVYSPLAVPWPYNPVAITWNFSLLRRRIQRFLEEERLQPEEVLLFTCLATPLVLRLVYSFPWARVVYDVVSDPKQVEPRITPYEQRLLRRADVTLFASATLLEQYRDYTKNPVLFRDGFNIELLEAKVETPPEVARLPRPRLLYIGGINRKLWVEAIEAICEAIPHGSVILMGPVAHGEIALPKLPNLHLLPPRRRYVELAGVLQAADVGLIPYRPDLYTGAMHPAKLNEYLVFGLPVVATATQELVRLAQEFPVKLLYFGRTPKELAEAGLLALANDINLEKDKIQILTTQFRWIERVREFLRLCENIKKSFLFPQKV